MWWWQPSDWGFHSNNNHSTLPSTRLPPYSRTPQALISPEWRVTSRSSRQPPLPRSFISTRPITSNPPSGPFHPEMNDKTFPAGVTHTLTRLLTCSFRAMKSEPLWRQPEIVRRSKSGTTPIQPVYGSKDRNCERVAGKEFFFEWNFNGGRLVL